MTLTIKRVLLTLILLTIAAQFAFAMEGSNASGAQKKGKIDLIDHVLDHYYLDFEPAGKIALPRILWDNGSLHIYSSTLAAINSGDGYTDKYYTEAGHKPQKIAGKIQPVTYKIVHQDGSPVDIDFSLTSHIVFFLLSGFITLFAILFLNKRYKRGIGVKTAPKGGFQNMIEMLVIFIRDDVSLPNIGPEKYMRYTPYLLTAFFMILIMNLFNIIPWAAPATADITVTAALAVTTFLITEFSSNRHYWKEIFVYPGIPIYIKPIIVPIEFMGIFTKPFALCIRLFANMVSGKMLILSVISLIFVFNVTYGGGVAYGTSWIWVLMTVFVFGIKFLVAFIQAYVFVMLSALFIGMAVARPEPEGIA